MLTKSVYLDCNATSPVELEVVETVIHYLREEFGNAGSRTHEFGVKAKQAVERARQTIGEVVGASKDEVIFTSGATESNNLALLGLAEHGFVTGRKHIVSTSIEHKAVLEPLEILRTRGFEVTLIAPDNKGRVTASALLEAVRSDTLLVSVMHANNETGVIQPIADVAAGLPDDVLLHVDAAQTFGKLIDELRNSRVDLISVSGHKVYGPKGVGSLIARRRCMKRPPLTPLFYGGGQERGLRPGTHPVHLIAGFGVAAKLALRDHKKRLEACAHFRNQAFTALASLGAIVNGDQNQCLTHVLNVSLPGIDSEAAMVALKGLVAVSNGSACTSASYDPSHVLVAMGLDQERIDSALRLSWCHLTEELDWTVVVDRLRRLS
jgi:cysteine desulfurase